MGDVARQIANLADADPALISYGDDAETGTEISTVLGSPDLAQMLIGWTATIPLAEGLARTIANARQRVDA
jgi:nucleoside-diphosphate-sugar epimerase